MYGFSPQPRYRRKVYAQNDLPTLTEQAHKEQCEINNILKRYQQTGVLDHTNQHAGTYNDYVDAPGYQDAQNMIAAANSLFESLPSQIRLDMGNDPAKFVDFMQNADNREAMEAYGLSTEHLPPLATPDNTPKETSPKVPKPPETPSEAPETPSEAP